MKRPLKFSESPTADPIWKSEPGEPPITSPGDWIAMMVQGGKVLSEEHDERRGEERPAEPPPRKAIISIHGRDVEECEIPEDSRNRRAA
jgi:hypothetical protein